MVQKYPHFLTLYKKDRIRVLAFFSDTKKILQVHCRHGYFSFRKTSSRATASPLGTERALRTE